MKRYGADRENPTMFDPSGGSKRRTPFVLLAVLGFRILHAGTPSADSLSVEMVFPLKSPVQTGRMISLFPEQKRSVLISTKGSGLDVRYRSQENSGLAVPAGSGIGDAAIGAEETVTTASENSGRVVVRQIGVRDGRTYYLVTVDPWEAGQAVGPGLQSTRGLLSVRGEDLRLISDPELKAGLFRKPKSAAGPAGWFFQDAPRGLKIWIAKEGMYVLTRSMIREAGWKDIAKTDPRNLRLLSAEGEVPVRLSGEEDGRFDPADMIVFWADEKWETTPSGERRRDVFTRKNVYWLVSDTRPGLRLANEAAGMPSSPENPVQARSFPFTLHVEENTYFYRLPYASNVRDGDYWFMSYGIVGGEKRDIRFQIESPDPYATDFARLQIKLWGSSQVLQVHDVEIYLNDRYFGAGSWQFNQPLIVEGRDFSPTYLREGENVLSVINRSMQGQLAQIQVDWFRLTYPRLYTGEKNFLLFKPPAYGNGKVHRFTLEKFKDPAIDLYKKGMSVLRNPDIRAVTDTLGQVTYSVRFMDIADENTEYVAIGKGGYLAPDSAAYIEDEDLRAGGADLVLIVPGDTLFESLEPYIAYRESQGLSVRLVALESIVNNFGYGVPGTRPIRDFLAFASANWNPAPEYVLLVGDGKVNNRDPSVSGNLIPVPMVQTVKYGAAASDNWYVRDDEDPTPRMAIGRWPVRNRKELDAVVAKTLAYEQSPAASWKNRYLLIGAHDASAAFRQQSESLILDVLDPSLHPMRMYLGPGGSSGDTDLLLDFLTEGVSLVNFRGHGGGAIWSDGGLLDLDDVSMIDNEGRLPVITSMTCFTADFSSGQKSLGEALLLEPGNGAVALWGSTGLGWVWNDYYLLEELYTLFVQKPDWTLGKAIQTAKIHYHASYSGELTVSEIDQYTLLGDPALRMAFPSEMIPLQLNKRSIAGSDTLRITAPENSPGEQVVVEWVAADRSALISDTLSAEDPWELEIQSPALQQRPEGIRVYAREEGAGQVRGYAPIAYGRTYVDSLNTTPGSLSFRDSLGFEAFVEDRAGIAEIRCVLKRPFSDTLDAQPKGLSGWFETTRRIPPQKPGTQISFSFIGRNGNGDPFESSSQNVSVPTLPNPVLQRLSFTGRTELSLNARIRNFGGSSLSCRLRFENVSLGFASVDTLLIPAGADLDVQMPFRTTQGNNQIRVTLQPIAPDTGLIQDRVWNESKTADRFRITPENGSLSGSQGSAWVGLDAGILCRVQPGSVGQNAVLAFDPIDDPEGLTATGRPIYRIDFGEGKTLSADADFRIPAAADTEDAYRPYVWDPSVYRWIRIPSERQDSEFVFRSRDSGYYSLYADTDADPPRIELQAGGQPLVENSYVPKDARFELIIEDPSGVDIRKDRIGLWLDDIRQEDPILPDSIQDPTKIVAAFRSGIEPGWHTVRVEASDVHGNRMMTEAVPFQVSERFTIRFLGNHPNPFNRETVFVYVLTDIARKVSLKIYTVSGRLIRTFDDADMTTSDYHEVVWDGTDEWGNWVANGVYFFSLRATGSRGTEEVTGKIAVLR